MKLWFFLNQNAAALQAVGSVLSVLVAMFTIPLLWWTKGAAEKAAIAAQEQASAARAQVDAAEAASVVIEQQLIAARDSAEAEREHSRLIQKQVNATLRPILVFAWRENPIGANAILRNDSATGIASGIVVYRESDRSSRAIAIELNILGPSSDALLINIPRINLTPGRFTAYYESQDGRRFITQAHLEADTAIFHQTSREVFDGDQLFTPPIV